MSMRLGRFHISCAWPCPQPRPLTRSAPPAAFRRSPPACPHHLTATHPLPFLSPGPLLGVVGPATSNNAGQRSILSPTPLTWVSPWGRGPNN